MWVPSQSFARLILTLVQDSPRSTVLEKQAASKHVGAENDGVASHQSPGQNDPITLEKQLTSKDVGAENDDVASQQSLGEYDPIASEEQPTGKDVGAENDGTGHDGKSTVKSTLESLAYLIFFRALPGIQGAVDCLCSERYAPTAGMPFRHFSASAPLLA